MIRVAYILTPITFGGSEKVSLNFLRHVNRERYEIFPILLVRPWENDPYFACELRRCGYHFERVPVAVRRDADPFRVPRVAGRIFALLREGSFHLAHTHGYFADICGLPAARLLGIPGISTCHGYISNGGNLKLYNMLDKIVLRLCTRIMAVSEGIRGDLMISGLDGGRIDVVHNAAGSTLKEEDFHRLRLEKRSSLSIGADEFVAGFAGRLSQEKGARYLIEAASEMKHHGKRYKLLIMGDGPERECLSSMVKKAGLDRDVLFTGFLENSEEWLPALDIFVLPSLTEGTPMALLEAMAMGIPVIASAVGGVPDVIEDGINGFLVPPGESRAIHERIMLLIDKPDQMKRFSRAGKETVNSRYNVRDWCRRIEQMYDSLAEGGYRGMHA